MDNIKIIARPKCSGKTKELIQLSLETGIPIFAATPSKENSLLEKSLAYFNKKVGIVNWSTISTCSAVYIDDAEEMVELMLDKLTNNNVEVAGITVSVE